MYITGKMHNPRVRPPSSALYTCITFPPQSAAFLRRRPPTRSRKPLQGAAAHLQRDWRSRSIRRYVKHFWAPNWFVPLLYWYAASGVCFTWIPSLAAADTLLQKWIFPPPLARHFVLNSTYRRYDSRYQEERGQYRFSDPLEPLVESH